MEKSFNRLTHMCRCDRVSIWQSLIVLLNHVNSYSRSDSAYVFLYNRSWSLGSYSQSEMQTLSKNAGLYTIWPNQCKQNECECVKMLTKNEINIYHIDETFWVLCNEFLQWWETPFFFLFFFPPFSTCSNFEISHLTKKWASIMWPNINVLLLYL